MPLHPPSYRGQDVWFSPDVFVNKSEVALWQPPWAREEIPFPSIGPVVVGDDIVASGSVVSELQAKTYLDNLRKTLKEISSNDKEIMNRVLDIHQDVFSIKNVKDEKSIPVGDIKKNLRHLEERKVYLSESVSGIFTSIDAMIEIDRKGVECVYYDNQLHLLAN